MCPGANEFKFEILVALKPELGQVTHQILLVLMIIITATIHWVLNLCKFCFRRSLYRHCAGFPCFISLSHLSRLISWNQSCPHFMQEKTEANLLSVLVDNTLSYIHGTVLNISCVLLGGRFFPGSTASKEFTCNSGDPSSIPGLGRSTGEGIDYPFLYSWASLVAQLVKNPPAMWETWV